MKPKTAKRIVSKGEYTRIQAKRFLQLAVGMGMLMGGIVLLYLAGLFALGKVEYFWGIWGLLVSVNFFRLAVRLSKKAQHKMKQAIQIDPGVPITRANTADLPAPDSLVRASSEPMQTQEAVLLRAAQGQATPPEQLVRPAGATEYGNHPDIRGTFHTWH